MVNISQNHSTHNEDDTTRRAGEMSPNLVGAQDGRDELSIPFEDQNRYQNQDSIAAPTRPVSFPSSIGTFRGKQYQLVLVSVPMQCTASGAGLCDPPLVAQLTIRAFDVAAQTWISEGQPADADDYDREVGEEDIDDLAYLIATVSLWTADGQSVAQDNGTGRGTPIRGDLSTTAQVFLDEAGIERVYFIFPRVQITSVGTFRVGVSLTGIWPDEAAPLHSSRTVVVTGLKAPTLTRVVEEESLEAGRDVGIDMWTARLLESLRLQGAHLSGSECSSLDSQ